jgi:hypothetical protein
MTAWKPWNPDEAFRRGLISGDEFVQRCDICGDPGGERMDELGRIDFSVNDHEVVHRRCWTRDPEASSWTPLRSEEVSR